MQLLKMRNLWLNSFFLVFILASCSQNISKWTETTAEIQSFENYFDSTNTPVRYKADIDVYGRFFSGILFIKYLNDTTCHVAFTTMPGNKLFEMQLTPKTDTIYECFDKLNRPAVLKGIRKNIRIFVMLDNFVKKPQVFKNESVEGIMWRQYTASDLYQFYQKEGEPINRIELLSKKLNKRIELDVKSFNGKVPSDISIHNFNYKLDIHLTQL